MNNKNLLLASIGIIVIIAIIASAVAILSPKTATTAPVTTTASVNSSQPAVSSSGSQVSTPVLLTDPPVVPNGTTSLLVQYTSISVHSTTSNGWISSNTQGSVNLMSLTNTSVITGSLNLSSNASLDLVRFYVSNASITINGTTYNVTVPGGQITAHLSSYTKLNNTSGILVQLYPVVVTIYTNTTPDFILVPSAKAVVVGNALAGKQPHKGEFISLTHREDTSLDSASPNITVTNASAVEVNGTTALSFTVTDNSNYSIMLRHMGLSGPENISVNTTIADSEASLIISKAQHILSEAENNTGNSNVSSENNVSVNGNASVSDNANRDNQSGSTIHAGTNTTVNVSYGTRNHVIIPVDNQRIQSTFGIGNGSKQQYGLSGSENGNSFFSGQANEIGDLTGNSSINVFVKAALANGTINTSSFKNELSSRIRDSLNLHYMENEMFQNRNRMLEFQIANNGSLQLPFSEDQFNNGFGYTLKPGESHTFTFQGVISLANGRMHISLMPGKSYSLSVRGEMGAFATANVTATT